MKLSKLTAEFAEYHNLLLLSEQSQIDSAFFMTGLDVIADADFRKAVREEFESVPK